MAVTTDDVVILALAEQHVTAGHAEDDVVAGLAVDQVGRTVVGPFVVVFVIRDLTFFFYLLL